MMRKNPNSQRWNKAQCECSTLWSLNVGGNRYHPEKASTTVKKWEEVKKKRWAIFVKVSMQGSFIECFCSHSIGMSHDMFKFMEVKKHDN